MNAAAVRLARCMARCRRTVLAACALLLVGASPAAARIAFVSERDGEPEIYAMNDDGSAPVNLSHDAAAPDLAPSWSPDGARIVYQRAFGGDADLWLMDADGSHQRVLVNSPSSDTAPSWSPDGRKIAFVSDRTGDDHLYVMNA